jgi:hypothetical protein
VRKSESQFVLGLLAVGATLLLMSNPRCGSGCKTVLQHLLGHELDLLF